MRLALAALAIAGAAGCPVESSDGWLEGRAFRKPVELHPSDPTALEDFPAAIVNTLDDDLENGARADGRDFVVTTTDGTILPIELERFDANSGRLALWVRLPKLAGPTTVFLYYGGDPLSADPTPVWPSLYTAVWHLADPELELARDSGPSGFELSQANAGEQPIAVDGIAGAARQFDGVDDELGFDDPGGTPLDPGSGSFSVCLWVRAGANLDAFDTALYKGGATGADAGYDFELGLDGWSTKLSDGASHVVFGELATFGDLMLNRWTQLCAVADRGARTVTSYTNGAPRSVDDLTPLGPVGRQVRFQLGRQRTILPFTGAIDEVRVYQDALPLAWVTAEYENLIDPDQFVRFGPEERAP